MYLGKIVEEAPAEELFAHPHHHYTRLLLDTVPDMENPLRDRAPASGEVPSPMTPPPGCAFHPRCAAAGDDCRHGRVERHAVGEAVVACHHPVRSWAGRATREPSLARAATA